MNIVILWEDRGTSGSGELSPLCGEEYSLTASAMGMSKLFTLDDERLRHVMVKGDMVITSEQRNSGLRPIAMSFSTDHSHHDPLEDEE